ncbi:MAG: hypothetical protein CL917_01360 [Deltaproteobacteria bacterium]|nr:hypothetical protein [Deltaproteobacteria bacterium]
MSLHPLIELSVDREVKQAKGFKAVAAQQTGETLEALYQKELESAPKRSEQGKKYLDVRTGRIPKAPQSGKDDRHAAMALGAWANLAAETVSLPSGETLQIIDSLVPLRTAAPDRAKGDADPNKGVEDLDLLGVLSDDRLAVVRVKYLDAEATRGGAGDTPLRALLSGLAQVAMVDADRAALRAEIEAKTGRVINDEAPALCIVASPRYWEICRKREAQKGAGWIRELERLGREMAVQIGVEVFYLGLELSGSPAWTYEEEGPQITESPKLLPAWPAGAGKLKPKPKSRAKKASAEDVILEADPTRAPKSYSISEIFEPGDTLVHPKFGSGVVQARLGPGKISVLFGEESKLLIHERVSS